MSRSEGSRRRWLASVTGVAVVSGFAAVAYATIPDSQGVINACYKKGAGTLRVADSTRECLKSETGLTWAQRGPQGPPGPPGPPGPAGTGPAKALGTSVIADGESKVIARHGPFTLTARCDLTNNIAEIRASTSQNGSAIVLASGTQTPNWQTSQQIVVAQSVGNGPAFATGGFGAVGADGTNFTGTVQAGGRAGGRSGKCVFGGFVVQG